MGRSRKVDIDLIRSKLIKTWQPVAAIAFYADIPVRTALRGLLQLEAAGEVKKARVRIDGHNEVHLFKKIEYTRAFNMRLPIDTSGYEA